VVRHNHVLRSAFAYVAAFVCHALVFVLVSSLAHSRQIPVDLVKENQRFTRFLWLNVPGPGGGGGGGGNRQPLPARPLQRRGRDQASVPSATASTPTLQPVPIPELDVADRVTIAAKPLGSTLSDLPGTLESFEVPSTASRGPGSGDGAGRGRGPGAGSGDGSGAGDGEETGFGGGVYRPGNGVTTPIPIRIERPRYTADAMRARVQGVVIVECVVRPSGMCTDIQVVRSLDPHFGLDDEAGKAAALWRFTPGTRAGRPVPVVVRIQLEFTIR
jgi:protein TonB